MSHTNEPKSSQESSSSSTIRNLFRRNESQAAPQDIPDTYEENFPVSERDSDVRNNVSTNADETSSEMTDQRGGFFSRFKTKWHSLLDAMKQQPEEDEENDAEETEAISETSDAVDLSGFKQSYKTPSAKPPVESREEQEKKKFFSRFKLSFIEASIEEKTEDEETEPPVQPEQPPVQKKTDTAVPKKPATKPAPPPVQKNKIRQTAPEQVPPKKAPFAGTVPEPSQQTEEHRQKQLPVFDVFADFAREQQENASSQPYDAPVSAKSVPAFQKDSVPSSAEMPASPPPPVQHKTEKAPSAVTDGRTADQKTHDEEIVFAAPPQKPRPAVPTAVSSQKTVRPAAGSVQQDNVPVPPRRTAEKKDIPSDNVIYGTPQSKQPSSAAAEKDLTEGHMTGVTYQHSNAIPFIIMVGKFTGTLREEYEAVRQYRLAHPAPPPVVLPPPTPALPPKPQKRTLSPKIIEKLTAVSAADSDEKSTAPVTAHTPPAVQPEKKAEERKEEKEEKVVFLPQEPKKPPKRKKKKTPADDLEQYEEIPDEPEKKSRQQRVSKAQKQRAAKEKREKRKIRLRSLFTGEEEFDPNEEISGEVIVRQQLDDYNEEKDADAIKTDISSSFQSVFVRTLILLGTSIISITVSLLAQCTDLFRENIRNGWLWFAVISFLMFCVSVIASRNPIVNGLMPLRHLKGNSDTAVAAASVAVAMQSVTSLFLPDIYVSGGMHLYTPLLILALLFNSAGKLLIITRTHYNFNFLVKPYPKYAGKIFTDKQNAEKMVRDLALRKPLVGYTRRARFMSNFLQLSYAPDPIEKMAAFIAPWTTAFSLVSGIVFGVLRQSFIGGLASFALVACMSIPINSLLAINLPLRRLCKTSLRSGAMITSYETVRQFCDTNAIMIDSSQLYPKGSVTLSGMRAFKQSMLKDALQAGAAIMYAVNGTMIHIFENIVQCSKESLPKVDNVIYEDGKGLVGWVNDQRILIGNLELLKSHNIQLPEKQLEDKYLNRGEDVIYISVSGELIAMFILSYKTNKNIANELKTLEQSGVNFVVRTVDPNLTRDKVAERFGLFYRCITILPTGLGNICHDAMSQVDEQSRAYLVTRGKLSSFAKAVSGCIKMKSGIMLAKILQYFSVGMGLLLVTMISFVSGFEKLGCMEMLIYIGFFAITSIIASLIKK